jgi:hypothetical protein
LDNDFNVADLVLEWVTCGSIEEWRNGVAHFLFDVTLLEVLFHLSGHPFEIHDAALARVAVVRGVEAHGQDHLLVLSCGFRELLG